MPTKHQKITLKIPERLKPAERELLGEEVIEFIRERVQSKGLDRKNRELPGYSESYAKSLNFKIAGKSKSKVDLTLSGDMLGAMTVLSHKRGEVTIGFEPGSPENARADGNIRGTYGKPKPIGPKRDFLGLTKEDLARIVDRLDPDDGEVGKAAQAALDAIEVEGEDSDGE